MCQSVCLILRGSHKDGAFKLWKEVWWSTNISIAKVETTIVVKNMKMLKSLKHVSGEGFQFFSSAGKVAGGMDLVSIFGSSIFI